MKNVHIECRKWNPKANQSEGKYQWGAIGNERENTRLSRDTFWCCIWLVERLAQSWSTSKANWNLLQNTLGKLRWLYTAIQVSLLTSGTSELRMPQHWKTSLLLFHRFQRCAKYDDSTVCHSAFLEFSYSVCNLIRNGIFITMCWTVNCSSWKKPSRELTIVVESCPTLRNKSYFQLLLCAAGLPLLMNGHCFAQTIHNIASIGNLLLFLVALNAYHTRTASMMYHALCGVVMNVQSTLVAVYNISRNLQTQPNDSIATLLYILELYLMLLVLLDSSTRVIKKVINPKLDIMSLES